MRRDECDRCGEDTDNQRARGFPLFCDECYAHPLRGEPYIAPASDPLAHIRNHFK